MFETFKAKTKRELKQGPHRNPEMATQDGEVHQATHNRLCKINVSKNGFFWGFLMYKTDISTTFAVLQIFINSFSANIHSLPSGAAQHSQP